MVSARFCLATAQRRRHSEPKPRPFVLFSDGAPQGRVALTAGFLPQRGAETVLAYQHATYALRDFIQTVD